MQKLFQQVASHLSGSGITPEMSFQPPADSDDISYAERQLDLSLPPTYVEFVTTVADGLSVHWHAGDRTLACFEMEPLHSSVEGLLGFRDWRLFSEDKAKEYGFPHVADPEIAMTTNRLMHYWLPFQQEGNGDYLSVNLNRAGEGQVIFDQHDWLDGGTGENGFFMADTISEFIESWASVCFSLPRSLWWKSVLTEKGVDWDSDEFDPRFRI